MDAFLKGARPAPKAAAPSAPAAPTFIPWVEKYRPKTVDDISHQDEVVAVLGKCLTGNDFPNLLFYGPPGTGKTSTILAMAHQMFGKDYKSRVLELNASDERGIQVVREKIKSFAQLAVGAKTVEIIAPITSRCAKFRFKPLDTVVLDERLTYICNEEKVKCGDEVKGEIRKVSGGDLRKAITYLQSAARLKKDQEIEKQDIFDIAGVVPDSVVLNVVELCKSGSYTKLQTGIQDIISDAYSAGQIVEQLHDVVLEDGGLKDEQKCAIMNQLALTDKCLIDGADEYLQIMSLCTVIMTHYTMH